jgi:tRNA pseudouridine38-40 synthase
VTLPLFGEGDEAPPAPSRPSIEGPAVRARLVVAYDGGRFHGFAAQPGVKTVGGTLAKTLERVLGHPVELVCAGRTDTGVHAWGQVVSFEAAEGRFDPVAVRRACNRLLAPAVVVREAAVAAPAFDARRDAVSRRYRYSVVNREVPDPFLAHVAWHVDAALDVRAMALACDPVIGEHDFASFCRRGPEGTTTVRRVLEARWLELGEGLLRFEIEGTAFCHQMVRSLVGTMVEMGRGKKRAGEMRAILGARDRAYAGDMAPPHGLCLWEVRYPA